MNEYSIEDFYHDFRQNALAGSEAREDYLEAEFMLSLARELENEGPISGFEPCHYRAPRGMRVDGYWFREDDAALDLFILDFNNRETLTSLTKTDIGSIFKRLENFFISSIDKRLYEELEETSPGYGLSRDIHDRQKNFSKVNLYLLSERQLSEQIQTLGDSKYIHWSFSYHIWDMSRFYRLSSPGPKEDLTVDLTEFYPDGLQCLPAHLNNTDYESYLLVIPGEILAVLYDKHGPQLLEQNVRCFLQARGSVNKGIRATIMSDPGMFFAYNNGITATAKQVVTRQAQNGIYITHVTALQIVNGGQTTASLFQTNRKDKASLEQVFVQMKLSVVDEEKSDEVVPKISEYANTQNKVNAADFFSNHPFHVRMQEFSRRIWAPAKPGVLRESKWFYERTRGQYADSMSKLTISGRKKFQNEYPKAQMITKTDLGKFENVWDDKPTFVSLGAQKNFAKYAERIGKEWEKDADRFNEFYYKCVVSRSIIFRRTEKLVSAQPWYHGDYRAQIVAYTLAMLSEYCRAQNKSVHMLQIWNAQELSPALIKALEVISEFVSGEILSPPEGISNIGEWCKKDACWSRLKGKVSDLHNVLPQGFCNELISVAIITEEKKEAVKTQKIDNGIDAQAKVFKYTGAQWEYILEAGTARGIFTLKEIGILEVATKIPAKIPSEKQAVILMEVFEKAYREGIRVS